MTFRGAHALFAIIGLAALGALTYVLLDGGGAKENQSPASAATAPRLGSPASGTVNFSTSKPEEKGKPDAPQESSDQQLHELLALARRDPTQAIAKAKSLYSGKELQRTLVYLAQETASQDWEKLSAFLAELPAQVDQEAVISLMARRAVSRDAQGFLKFANAQESPLLRGQLLKHAIYALVGEKRIPEATAALDSMPYSTARSEALFSLTQGMGRQDPAAAVAWADKLELREEQQAALKNLVMMFRQSGDAASIELIATTTQDAGLKAMCERQLGSMGATGKSGAGTSELAQAASIASIPDSNLQDANSILGRLQEPSARQMATRNYVNRLLRLSPKQATDWVQSSPPQLRPYAFQALASAWFDSDSMSLSEWANKLPPGSEQDIVLASMAGKLRSTDLDAAIKIAAQISDEKKRSGLLRSLNR